MTRLVSQIPGATPVALGLNPKRRGDALQLAATVRWLKFLIVSIVLLASANGGGVSPKEIAEFVLDRIKAQPVSHVGIIKMPFDGHRTNLFYESSEIKKTEAKEEFKRIMHGASLEPAKSYYHAEQDFFLVMFDKDEPQYALYHAGKYDDDTFDLYFCTKRDTGVLIGGSVRIQSIVLDAKNQPHEKFLEIRLNGWNESSMAKSLSKVIKESNDD